MSTSVNPDVTSALARAVAGPVHSPGTGGFADALAGFQAAARHEPGVIVSATGAEDVRAAVTIAAGTGMTVGMQSTGHGQAPGTTSGPSLLIDTRQLSGVRIDPGRRTAHVGAGARWHQVLDLAAEHGLAPLSGSSPHVGAVGYTVAGGLGLMARRYGYAADHVRGLDLVTADGTARRVTVDRDPDLFWAVRGGGGNFGVVTAMEIDLVPVTRLYGGGMHFAGDLIPRVLRTWLGWTAGVPDTVTSSVGIVPFPDIPAVPEAFRGRVLVHVRVAFTGPAAEGEQLVAPLRAIGPRLTDTLGELPYRASGSIHAEPDFPHAYVGDTALLPEVTDETVDRIADLSVPGAPVPCVIQLRHLGGGAGRQPDVANAVGHRDASYLLQVLSGLDGTDQAAVADVHSGLLATAAPGGVRRSLGMTFRATTVDEVRSGYSDESFARLAAVKTAYDPADLFRPNHHIPPAA
ncbi:FAD-binding oxidoreductase [Amycolatopsis suaedae]|uniref:FAD-binding oxidoreductase n=1 Tax=Amycolatopsis suaedae TaxID=2510978 RepID=A0A4Q7J809_9PSEU|nr:FAD-binding oxidoreductase [Amycolatopsis suaedae]RZQ63337.1 FAD-binding oxidoreductase [Amycolatopsis suaedae]